MSLALSACAASGTAPLSTVGEGSAGPKTGTAPLTPAEMELDCKAINGRMQVRILQIRDFAEREQATLLARSLQSASATVLGGTKEGTDPQSRYAQDKAKLEAFNSRLAEKGCPTFDLENELKPKPVIVTPTPVRD